MLAQVHLDSELVTSLEAAVRQQGENVEDVLAELIQQYLRQTRREKIRQETEWYQTAHAELKKIYGDQHIAIHEKQVVDHDQDVTALVQRIRQQYGRIPILITQVYDQPVPEFAIRRPQLVRDK
jgi:hypothetical protein